ncbi:MAG: sugar transferase [Lachnospiraceae bacterium]|nr:sugar transferase [Lachnospiraceae bacterium]
MNKTIFEKNTNIEDEKVIVRRLEQLFELAVFAVAYYYFWKYMYRGHYFSTNMYFGRGKFVLVGIYASIMAMILHLDEGDRFGYRKLFDIVLLQWFAICATNVMSYMQLALIANVVMDIRPMIYLTLTEFPISLVLCTIYTYYYHSMHVPMHMLMIYGNERSVSLKLKFDSDDKNTGKYHVDKLISVDVGLKKLKEMINDYDSVIISDIPAETRNDILKYCYANGIRTYLTPKISDIITSGSEDISLFDTPLSLVKGLGMTVGQRFVKRFFDIVLSLIALVLLSPLMIGICIAIKMEDHGPIFYKQRRVTRNGEEFDILKFRSMIVDAEAKGIIPAQDHDPRITKVGNFIRACRADELPQLINILKGEMSIVGPRPERVEHVDKYKKLVPEFVYREKVKGGLTGYAQIYGKYNTTALDKLKYDLMYIEEYSFFLDFKIILMTVRILFEKESTEGFDKVITEEDIQYEIDKSKGKN